jgi:hypothetical protein
MNRLFGRSIARQVAALCVLALGATSAFAAKSIAVPSGKIKTIMQAMAKAAPGDTVWVEPGVYRERIIVNPGVALKSRLLHKAIINGSQRGIAVTLGKKATVSGFEIRNATIGVFAKSQGNAISRCRIVHNWQTGIICVRNLAKIEDNIIAFNNASGIQVYNVSVSTGTINHNTIAYNANHGIAVGDNSPVVIQNNIIAYNERFGISAKTGQKGVRIIGNSVFGNLIGSPPPPQDNVCIDPAFASPRAAMDFSITSDSLRSHKGSDNETPGIRPVY